MKKLALASIILFCSSTLFAQLPDLGEASKKAQQLFNQSNINPETIKSLIADFGVETVVDLSVNNAFNNDPSIFIPIPSEYSAVKDKVLQFGGKAIVDQVEEKLNHAAEQSIELAKPHLKTAINNLNLEQLINIAKNKETGFSTYMKSSSQAAILTDLTPVVKAKLEESGTYQSLNEFFKLYKRYAGFFGRSIPNGPNLETYVATKAIDGLFLKLGQKEANFRAEKLPSFFGN